MQLNNQKFRYFSFTTDVVTLFCNLKCFKRTIHAVYYALNPQRSIVLRDKIKDVFIQL